MIAEFINRLENLYFSSNDIINGLKDNNTIWLHCEFAALERQISELNPLLPEAADSLKIKEPFRRRQIISAFKRDATQATLFKSELHSRMSVSHRRKLENTLLRLMSWAVVMTNALARSDQPSQVSQHWLKRHVQQGVPAQ